MKRLGMPIALVGLVSALCGQEVDPALAAGNDKPLSSDKFTVTEMVAIPPQYTVGDPVELRLTLLPKEGVQVVKSRDIPNQPWVNIRSVDVQQTPPYVHVSIRFIPFAAGSKTLPPIPLGDIVLEGIRIHTASVLDAQNPGDLASPREPLVLPQTELFLAFGLLVIVGVPLLIWRLRGPARTLMHRVRVSSLRKKPHRRLLKELKRLGLKAGGLSGPDFYSEFSTLLRTYLSGRLKALFVAATTPELEVLLAPLPSEWAYEWVRLIRRADVVRFDGRQPELNEKLSDIEVLKAQAALLESREGLHVDL